MSLASSLKHVSYHLKNSIIVLNSRHGQTHINRCSRILDTMNPELSSPSEIRTAPLDTKEGLSILITNSRYITVMLDESKTKLYGMDRANEQETVYITEGPFDSHFLTNAIAMCGSDVNDSTLDYRDSIGFTTTNHDQDKLLIKLQQQLRTETR